MKFTYITNVLLYHYAWYTDWTATANFTYTYKTDIDIMVIL